MILRLFRRCRHFCGVLRGLFQDSPAVFSVVVAVILLLVLLASGIHFALRYFFGRGAVLLDLSLLWLFVCLIVRTILFPGSVLLYKRSSEAGCRVEVSRLYWYHTDHLFSFLAFVAKDVEDLPNDVTPRGVLDGFSVLENIVRSFRLQMQHDVLLSSEQVRVDKLAKDVLRFVNTASVRARGSAAPGDNSFRLSHSSPENVAFGRVTEEPRVDDPADETLDAAATGPQSSALTSWVRGEFAVAQGMMRNPWVVNRESMRDLEFMVDGSAGSVASTLDKLKELVDILATLRNTDLNCVSKAVRLMRVPTLGSLDQMRVDLMVRYGGQHCWVPRKGGRLDGMYIPWDGGSVTADEGTEREDAPLKSSSSQLPSGPTLIWCCPNAGYYEVMVFQPGWIEFYLSQGCNLFLFNYSGYGRSSGSPSPSRLAGDADAVVHYLKSRGVTNMGVHGRSIGGIPACHMARAHPDVIRLLVADRTMSTLADTARYSYGEWAAKGLGVSFTRADNVTNFVEARCHKVMVCDPKDHMIPDLAALRTGVALRLLKRMAPEERLALDDDRIRKLAEALRFFEELFLACEKGAELCNSGRTFSKSEGTSERAVELRMKVTDSVEQPSGCPTRCNFANERVAKRWLEEHAGLIFSAMASVVDQVRSVLDFVVEQLDSAGVPLDDTLADNPGDICYALRCMLANLQVWGSLGAFREGGGLVASSSSDPTSVVGNALESEIQRFLQKGDREMTLSSFSGDAGKQRRSIEELAAVLTPEIISAFHRRLGRNQVAQVRNEFGRRLGILQHSLAQVVSSNGASVAEGDPLEPLRITVLQHLGEVEDFLASIGRFFKSAELVVADLGCPSAGGDSSTDGIAEEFGPGDSAGGGLACSACAANKIRPREFRPCDRCASARYIDGGGRPIDHAAGGYVLHVDCGHNGNFDETEFRHLALHLRRAQFGKIYEQSGRSD
eukprot:TRINITY_DN26534_c0_g2_i1.p1 TRINITY_DN26534_c0_g2~~TRINITY_DN26534_c0_g2_i1.p1  ORF type:complete len:953 (-),score=164.27 TRINITY_DN26534_c0_g2_i1:58-2916(-)